MKTANQNQNRNNTQSQSQSKQPQGGAIQTIKSTLSHIPGNVQQFGSSITNQVSHLSTTQKVVGGSALALGAGWFAANKAGWIGNK